MNQHNSSRRRTWLRLAALASALSLIAIACGGDDGDEGGNGAGDGGSSTTVEGAAAPEGENDPDATLTYSYSVVATNLDPHTQVRTTDHTYTRLAYDTLLEITETGDFEPSLAESWEYVSPTELVFHLRDDVVFHDGTPFNADVVVENIERAASVDGAVAASELAAVSSVEAQDEHTVVFRFEEPNGVILGVLAGPGGMMISPAAFETDLSRTPVGTGAYRVVAFGDDGSVTYERFADAWRPERAPVQDLQMISNAESGQRVNQLLTGQADVANIDGQQVPQLDAEGFQFASAIGRDSFTIIPNMARPAMQSLELRTAIDLAIDREALLEGIAYGSGEISNQLLPSTDSAFNPDVMPEYDPERAMELIEASGIGDTEIILLVPATALQQAYAEAVQAMLTDVGLNVRLQTQDPASMIEIWRGGCCDLFWRYFQPEADPSLMFDNAVGEDSVLNISGPPPAEIAEPLAESFVETDPDTRRELHQEIARVGAEQRLWITLLHPAIVVSASPDVTGLTGFVNGMPPVHQYGMVAR